MFIAGDVSKALLYTNFGKLLKFSISKFNVSSSDCNTNYILQFFAKTRLQNFLQYNCENNIILLHKTATQVLQNYAFFIYQIIV